MFALVDCNNFYASCERLFKPHLEGKPVIVLSNNDGCVIARSQEAKDAGVEMGVPAFKIKDLLKKNKIEVFSSNYTLYGDISRRVMNTLTEFAPNIEVYSIDEAFIDLRGMNFFDLEKWAIDLKETVRRWTGIPISIGIAPTKSLAKMANKKAKKIKLGSGVFIINDNTIFECLKSFPVNDVWGIGRQYAKKLYSNNVLTAYDLTQLNDEWIRKNLTIQGLRLIHELRGNCCHDMNAERESKKAICTSRSFGKLLSEYMPISEAVSNYAAKCAQKLRKQESCASNITVFIHTNQFREDLPQYAQNITITLPQASNNTFELIRFALIGLKAIFKDGFKYKKAGVIVTGLFPQNEIQGNLFDTESRAKSNIASSVMDKLNKKYGKDTIIVGSMGFEKMWKLRQEKLSPCYTTNWNDIINVKVA